MNVEKLIEILQGCRPDAIVLTDRKDVLTDYLIGDLTEVTSIYQGIGYKVSSEAPSGGWVGAEPWQHQNCNEPLQGIPAVYIGNGTSIKTPVWEQKG